MTVPIEAPLAHLSPAAQRALVLARAAAESRNSPVVDRDHLMTTLLRVRSGLAARVAASLGARTPDLVRHEARPPSHIPFTPALRQAITDAGAAAQQRGAGSIGTVHLLLGVLRGGPLAGLTHEAVEAALTGRRGQ
ncbi:Clp protease N-terminal domain-containing protein [Symbioplanes lichenis]|uniref:Clp protease N-terminal domain-containing protein n=1 Tax=Symbioplanes lichenis TaxID=1629072 RepID=UPI002739C381|nr:Clp protease N-terminal domain-containing protein [Actinoplanes lichenis]